MEMIQNSLDLKEIHILPHSHNQYELHPNDLALRINFLFVHEPTITKYKSVVSNKYTYILIFNINFYLGKKLSFFMKLLYYHNLGKKQRTLEY